MGEELRSPIGLAQKNIFILSLKENPDICINRININQTKSLKNNPW